MADRCDCGHPRSSHGGEDQDRECGRVCNCQKYSPQGPVSEGDEHSADVELLQMGLRDARHEIARLRGDRLRIVVETTGDGYLPARQHAGDAGFDLFVSVDTYIGVGEFQDIPCGISIQLPANMWGLIIGRSSTMRKRGLLVLQSVIDSGYRGSIFTGVTNLSGEPMWVNRGERLGQLIPFNLDAGRVAVVEGTVDTGADGRGDAGFGSTGM